MNPDIREALLAVGFELRHRPRDGENRARCLHCDKGPNDDAGCIRIDGARAVGLCQRCGRTVRVNTERGMAPRASAPAVREANEKALLEQRQLRQKAAATAAKTWAAAAPAPDDHPYLVRKGLPADGLRFLPRFRFSRVNDLLNALLVPMRNVAGELVNLQGISPAGTKRFLCHAETRDSFCTIWRPTDAPYARTLFIAEGWATARAYNLMRGIPGLAAMSSGNMGRVARIARGRHPLARIIIAADPDPVGRDAAFQAAAAVHADVAEPVGGGDWADLWTRSHTA